MIFADRLRASVEALLVSYGEHNIKFTISLGVSEINYQVDSATEWLEQADQALYKSKNSGRNWTTLFSD